MRKKGHASSPITCHAVLLESSRHNIQSSTSHHKASCLKGRNSIRKTDFLHSLNKVDGNNSKKPAEGSASLCLSTKKATVEVQASTNSSEVDELKRRLQEANLQMAEVVAQSAIVVRDVQYAAGKEIAKAMFHANSSAGQVEKDLNVNSKGSFSSMNTQVGRGFHDMGVGTTEQELASARQELADCKIMLADMQNQLKWASSEKEKVEMYLHSSLQTSLKLQDSLVNQRTVMQLELLLAEDRGRNEASLLVQSLRNQTKYLQEHLNVALSSKADADCLIRGCIQLLCNAQIELLTFNTQKKQQCCVDQWIVEDKLHQLQNAQEQVKEERHNLGEAYAQNAIAWTVLECVWEGAVKSLLQSGSCCFSEHNSNISTPRVFLKKTRDTGLLQTPECPCSRRGEFTPSGRQFPETPRAAIPREDGHGGAPAAKLASWEDVLRQNLQKSEIEVGMLGNNVNELRTILKKVTLLLDCISKSSINGHETKFLMREIIEQLRVFHV